MKKRQIVQKKEEFNEIIRTIKPYKSKYMNIYIRKNICNETRFGISIPKKYGKAVERNKIKRQLKEIIDNNKMLFKNDTDYIIIVRDAIKNMHYLEIQSILFNIMNEIENRGVKWKNNIK